ncbi:MAG: Holliday junction branch migration protein RuvA [Clostridia bacterium]|nr:Holliday junction branch migration protein RuvA [Clostridia bacterium]
MISFIRGIVAEKSENLVVLDCNGVGYEIFVSSFTLDTLTKGEVATIKTYMQVREDGVALFGFIDLKEKDIFLKLINISGIGPKMAITILSQISIKDLVSAISTGNTKMLSAVKGLGKKTAERIVLELSNAFDTLPLLEPDFGFTPKTQCIDEAVDVLVSMGLVRFEATRVVKDVATPSDTTEDIIKKALKYMNK